MRTDRPAKSMFASLRLVVALCAISITTFGQGIQSGSVLGAARDSSGAVVSGVQVTLKNTETGISVGTTTNAQGEYLFPRVGPGKYQVEFVAGGFKRYVQPLTVQVVMSTTVDATLEVGELNQTVTVSGQPPLLETASGSLGTLVPNRIIADLPSRGGNPMMVFMLSPGLAQVNGPALAGIGNNGPVSGSGYVAYNSSNGGDSNGNYYQLDGAANERTDQPSFQPPTEQVEEINIMTNTYDAQYGRTQGALINVVTKSGTNEFHGSAYEFFENDVLNANTFFGNLNGTKKPPFRYNQFGGSLGGPIIRNRTFFFANYEGDQANQPRSQVESSPTPLERQGDFSQTVIGGKPLVIYNPFTTRADPNNPGKFIRDPFPNSVIPSSLLNPVALNYMKFLQLPNFTANQVFGNLPSPAHLNYYSGRVDHNFSDKLRVFGRTSISWLNGGDAGSALQPFFYPESNHRYSVSVGLTWSLTPTTIVELFGGWVRTAQLDPQAVPTDTKQLGFSPAYDAAMPVPNLAPGLNVASYETILGRGTRWDNEGPWSFNSNVTHIFGRHNLKAGFQTDIYQSNSGGINPPVLNFTGGFTQGPNPTTTGANIGSGLADLLLGTFAGGSFSSPTNTARTRKYYGLYVQEDYRVTSRLSLNLGLRWDGWQRMTDRFNGMNIGWAYNTPNPVQGPAAANYALHPIPELSVSQFSSALTGGYLFASPDNRAAGASQLNNWSPRFGFAYRVTDKTVLRGGYGLFKSFLYWGASSSTGFSASTDAVGTIDGITPYNLLNNPFPLGVTQPSGASLGLLTSVGSSATFTDQNLTPQTMTRWNFGIQRQLSGNMVMEAQYVGSTFFNTTVGNVSAISGTGDPNSLALHNISNQIFTTLGPTGRLNQTVPNPFFGVLPSNSTLGGTSQISVMNLLSAYPEYSSVTSSHPSGGRGYYHSLQLTATKRYSHGFTAMGTYTFAKDIERRYRLNTGDDTFQKMLYPFSIPHRFTLAGIWDLPFGPGHAIGWNKGFGSHLVGGWQVNVQWIWQSGLLALLKTPIVETGVNPALPSDQRGYNNWFNKSAFTVLPAWTLRTAPVTDPWLRGGPISEWDTSLFKNITVTERVRLQIRFEAFNVFNLHSFQSPDTNPNSGTYGSALTLTEQPRIIQNLEQSYGFDPGEAMTFRLSLPTVLCVLCARIWAGQAPGVDEHTVALWLFDEPQYQNITLTDATANEYDLTLQSGGQLVPGKFGNALKLTEDSTPAVAYAGAQGWYNIKRSPPLRFAPEKFNVGYFDWTWEFWFQATTPQVGLGTVFEMRSRAYGGGSVSERNSLVLSQDARSFILRSPRIKSPKAKLDVVIPTDEAAMSGHKGGWHHIAFTYTAHERQIRHYVDGVLQPLPVKGGFLPVQGPIEAFTIGRNTDGNEPLVGLIDETRLSDVVRYREPFPVPRSFSSKYGEAPPVPSVPNGPPLLFNGKPQTGALNLGSRKHVFIDGSLIDTQENLAFHVNPPRARDVTDFKVTKPWEAGPRFGPGVPDILHVYDDGSEIRLIYTNGAMWGGKKPDAISMAVSKDGLHWAKPDYGVVLWDGSRKNNILLTDSSQGTMFKDPNPKAPADERYKYIAYVMQRGIYVYVSPDGIHWRRNETIALPFDCGGGVEAFWDDQRGLYEALIRHEGFNVRLAALAETREILKPWPFKALPHPRLRGNLNLPTITEELPVAFPVDEQGRQVYRTAAIKYQWAPDTYLAFPWRYKKAQNVRPGSDMTVSRDGVHWHSYGDPLYLTADWRIEGRKVVEALVNHGLIRRGNELWQYATARFTAHGGASYGGEEYDSGLYDRLVRLVQRLDGFVSLDAGASVGTMTTRPLIFKGNRLILNIASKGMTRVAILDASGKPLNGFTLADCNGIQADSTEYRVAWRNRKDLGHLAGRPIRLQFQMRDAKLYSLQFLK